MHKKNYNKLDLKINGKVKLKYSTFHYTVCAFSFTHKIVRLINPRGEILFYPFSDIEKIIEKKN